MSNMNLKYFSRLLSTNPFKGQSFGGLLRYAVVLNIYSYSSFMSHDGIGKQVVEQFETASKIKTKVTIFPDSFRMVNQLELDAQLKRPLPDLIIGFDQNTWPRVQPFADKWEKWTPKDWEKIPSFLKVDSGFLPFDYGELGFIASREGLRKAGIQEPLSLNDLLTDRFKKNFIIEDPRTSTPGLFFLNHIVLRIVLYVK
jgi:thiamine transport system substrate-binding protein